MISIETVGLQLHLLASAFRRKISSDQITAYHAVLDRHIHDEREFIRACEFVLESEANFPPVSLLLRLSREASRNRSELGVPWVRDHAKKPLGSLRDWTEAVDRGKPVPGAGNFKDAMEAAVWEEAVRQAGGGPSTGEGAMEFLKRVSDVMNRDAELSAQRSHGNAFPQ